MSFFDKEVPKPEPEERFREPEWAAPPENMVGGTVPVNLVLANTGDVAVVLGGFTAYPTGVAFDVHLLWREHGDEDRHHVLMAIHHPAREGFRFGVELADGRRAFVESDQQEDGPRLTSHSGSGSPLHYQIALWLWPLPPDGPLRFACQWHEEGIPESTGEVDAGPIRDAATRAVELWPDERPVS